MVKLTAVSTLLAVQSSTHSTGNRAKISSDLIDKTTPASLIEHPISLTHIDYSSVSIWYVAYQQRRAPTIPPRGRKIGASAKLCQCCYGRWPVALGTPPCAALP